MNNYHLYDVIGTGKYSVVYKGRKKKSIEYTAIKSMEKSRRKKLLNEVKIFSKLNHPNIIKFYAWYETRNHLWLICEYASGGDLLQLIEQDKSLPEQQVKLFARDLIFGLQYIHSKGIVYADLKPANILINEFSNLKIYDFGKSQRIIDMIQTDNSEQQASKKGTPYYMAPELFQEDGVFSFQSDIWALGCVIYELATGKPPFVSQSFAELVNLILKAEVPKVEGFSKEFNDILSQMLSKDPLKRIFWGELIKHPFWNGIKFENLTIPEQHHFNNWVKKKNIILPSQLPNPLGKEEEQKSPLNRKNNSSNSSNNINGNTNNASNTAQNNNNSAQNQSQMQFNLASEIQKQAKTQTLNNNAAQPDINIMRLSLNVRKNLQKEDANQQYQDKLPSKDIDIKLENRNQEVDLGARGQEEDEEEFNNNEKEEEGGNQADTIDLIKQDKLSINKPSTSPLRINAPIGSNNSNVNNMQKTQPSLNTQLLKQQCQTQSQQQQSQQPQQQQPQFQQQQQQPLAQQQQQPQQQQQQQLPLQQQQQQLLSQQPQQQGLQGNLSQLANNQKGADKANKIKQLQGTFMTDEISSNLSTPSNIKSPLDGQQTPVIKTKQIPLEQLFTHNTDNAVKPIIGNRDIEKIADTTFIKSDLPFDSFTPEEIINGIENPQIEQHFEIIYSQLSQQKPNVDQLNILNYFETIIQHSNVSNRLINSQFMNLLLKILKNGKQIQIKIRVGSIIGLLIRHATVIENELSALGIPNILIELIRQEQSNKVRRRAIAALGEYLFYAATQIDEDANNVVWELSPLSYQFILKLIQNQKEDEIVILYTLKTVENISAQSLSTGTKFSNPDFANGIIQVFLNSKSEQIKVCCSICLTHMTVLNNQLIETVFEKLAPTLNTLLSESSQRIQQSLLTMINMYILNCGHAPKPYEDNKEFLNLIVQLTENTNNVIRGKAVLMILLLIKINNKTLVHLSEGKFFNFIEKLQRDTFKYVQQCLLHLLDLLEEVIPQILKIIADEFVKIGQGKSDASQVNYQDYENSSQLSYGNKNLGTLRGNLCYLTVVLAYLNSNTLKIKMYNHPYLETMFSFINNCDNIGDSKIMEDVKPTLFLIYETIVDNGKYIVNNHDFFLKSIAPKLWQKFMKNEQKDIRFNSLKLFIDIFSQVMSDSHIYDEKKTYGKMINEFVVQNILPNLKSLLLEQDTIGFYSLKLVNLLIEQNNKLFVPLLKKLGIISVILEFFQKDTTKLTQNTFKIILGIIQNQEMTLEELSQYNINERIAILLNNNIQQQQEWACESLLDMVISQFAKLIQTLQGQGINIVDPDKVLAFWAINQSQILINIKSFDPILDTINQAYNLLKSNDYNIINKACIYIINAIYVYGGNASKKSMLFKADNQLILLTAIKNNSSSSELKNLSKLWLWGLSIQDNKSSIINEQQHDIITEAIEKLKNCEEKSIQVIIKDILKIIG